MNQKKLRSRSLSLMVLAIVLPLGWFPVFTLNPATRAGEPFEEIDRNDFLVQFRQAAHELDSLYKNVRIEGTHVATRPLRSAPGNKEKDKNNEIPTSPSRTIASGFSFAQRWAGTTLLEPERRVGNRDGGGPLRRSTNTPHAKGRCRKLVR